MGWTAARVMKTDAAETDRIYAAAAHRYDRLLWLMSLGSGGWYRRNVVEWLDLPRDGCAVDLGAGTGGLALAMQEVVGTRGRVVAIDRSPEMLAEAARLGVRETVEGTFDELPFEDASVDGLACGYAIRYASDLGLALTEIHRVLRPGARVALMEMAIPESRLGRTVASILIRRLSPGVMMVCCGSRGVGALMGHFWDSVASFPPRSEVVARMQDVGFRDVRSLGPWGMLTEFRARV